jgi:hypothetical protein
MVTKLRKTDIGWASGKKAPSSLPQSPRVALVEVGGGVAR